MPPAFVYALAGALLLRREATETTGAITILPMVSSSTAGVAATGTW